MSHRQKVRSDLPYPLGASWDGDGVQFAVYAPEAQRVELCLFDSADEPIESVRVDLPDHTGYVWHGYFEGIGPGQVYGYRAHGPFAPGEGKWFNPHKLLFDPYARAVARPMRWASEMFGFPTEDGRPKTPESLSQRDDRDSAEHAPLAAVIEGGFDWEGDQRPLIPRRDTIIYEMHVKGFTKLHPSVPEELRGTYAGLASDAAVEHFQSLGVTAVELLPVHHHVSEARLDRMRLSNYWGYNTLAFFAPEPRYAADPSPEGCVREFKQMVKTLHAAGIEVFLDVVYNHTCEGNERGPTISWRGFGNHAYYRLDPLVPGHHINYSGTGNTTDTRNPYVIRMILDSLRYWVEEMHVDGFRFDLAVALGRESDAFDPGSGFFDAIAQDPVLRGVKLIGEPWDIGWGGYQVGRFPNGWSEWNGKYRDDVRRFWKGDKGMLGAFATRFAGSSDLYERPGREAAASVNFITSHDGFTLEDLVSYERKHNLANGEHNRDGDSHNNSSNYGTEGPTNDASILEVRARQKRNFLATLLLSAGTPMMAAGDEIGRTQKGNNNAYCQDNEISWLHWDLTPEQEQLLRYVRRLVEIRKGQPIVRRSRFFSDKPVEGTPFKEVSWHAANGQEMLGEQWADPAKKRVGILIGAGLEGGDPLFLMVNAGLTATPFHVPPAGLEVCCWERVIDTALPDGGPVLPLSGHSYLVQSRALVLLRIVKPSSDEDGPE